VDVGDRAVIGWLGEPGRCPVDDAPHTGCTSPDAAPIVIVQLPCRDALVAAETPASPTPAPGALRAEQIQATLPPGQFTTGTYRRKKR
jgi:hypothetical protein